MGPDAWQDQKKLGPKMLKSRCLQVMYHGIVQKVCSWYLYGTMVHTVVPWILHGTMVPTVHVQGHRTSLSIYQKTAKNSGPRCLASSKKVGPRCLRVLRYVISVLRYTPKCPNSAVPFLKMLECVSGFENFAKIFRNQDIQMWHNLDYISKIFRSASFFVGR